MEKTSKEVLQTRERPRVQKSFSQPSRTLQSFKDECDINTIMSKYEKNGLIDHVNTYGGQYGELPDVVDYHENLNQILAAQEAFASLTANIRDRFQNDPGQFLEFVSDPENADEMRDLGLLRADLPEPQSDAEPSPDPDPDNPLEEDGSAAPEAT